MDYPSLFWSSLFFPLSTLLCSWFFVCSLHTFHYSSVSLVMYILLWLFWKGIAAGPKMMILNDSSSLISDSISFQLLSDRFYKYSFHYLFAMMNRLIGLHQDFTNHSTVHILLSIHSLAFHPSLILSFLFSIRDQYHYYQPIPWFVSLSQTNFECIWWFSSSPCIVVISTTIRPICAFTFYSGPILLSILPSILLLL